MEINMIIITVTIGMILIICCGRNKGNYESEKTIRLLTKNVNFAGVICPIALMLQVQGKHCMQYFAYGTLGCIAIFTGYLYKNSRNKNNNEVLQNAVVVGSFYLYMFISSVSGKYSCILSILITIIFVYTLIFLDKLEIAKIKNKYNECKDSWVYTDEYGNECEDEDDNEDDDDDEYEEICNLTVRTIGSISSILLGFLQLQWFFDRKELEFSGVIIIVFVILYILKFRFKYIQDEKKSLIVLVTMVVTQLLLNLINSKIIIAILILAILYSIYDLIKNKNIDNVTTFLGLLIIGSTVNSMFHSIALLIIVTTLAVLVLSRKMQFIDA